MSSKFITEYPGPSSDTSNGPSGAIWADCPALDMIADPGLGDHVFDNFALSNLEDGDQYQALGDTAPVHVVDTLDGRLTVTTGATNNHQSMLATAVDLGHISDADGEKAKLWFEARVKVSSIADAGIFVGLAAEADAAVDFLDDDSADIVTTVNGIGFHTATASPAAVRTVYHNGSGEATEVEAGVHTLVAATYVKLGFVYDPNAVASERIKYYVNGTPTATAVTATNIAASTFPDSVNMGLMLTTKTGEAVTKSLIVDWWRFAQIKPGE